jgi:hypothetical protein
MQDSQYVDVGDVPLCEGDLILYDIYMFGWEDEDSPDRYARGRIVRIDAASICVRWLSGDNTGSSSNVSHEYVREITAGLAPKVPGGGRR